MWTVDLEGSLGGLNCNILMSAATLLTSVQSKIFKNSQAGFVTLMTPIGICQ